MAPLRAFSSNPNGFTNGTGQAIYLTGSQAWNTLQDWGTDGSIQSLDFTAFVNMLVAHRQAIWKSPHESSRGRRQKFIPAVKPLTLILLALTTATFTAPADEPEPAVIPPAAAASKMSLPDGFRVDLIAGEPDIVQPVAFTFDDRGRLWVAENLSYPRRAPEGQGHDRIIVFEDTHGDGHFDKRTVFASNLDLVTGLQFGFGGVWVAAAPSLMFIPVHDGDTPRPAGPPQILLDGWGFQDTHNTLSTLVWGPDGWLYGGHGIAAHSNVGAPGAPDEKRIAFDGSVWRYHPTKRLFEVFAEGLTNPWGIDYNDRGQIFATGCVIPHLWHVVQGARFHRAFGQHAFPFTYDDIKTITDHNHWAGPNSHAGREGYREEGKLKTFEGDMASGGGHAHAGGMIYLGNNWPAQYRDQVFMFNLHGHRVNEDLLERSGSGYTAHHGSDFLFANDPWSLWLNLQYGPDGSVFAIDFYEKNICHTTRPELYDRSNGRIFRISYGAPTRGKVDLRGASDEELVKAQLNPNDWHVRHARRILQERGPNPKVQEALRRILENNPDETRRLRALWALHLTEGLTKDASLRLLRDRSEYLRAWTIQLLAEDRQPSPPVMADFERLASEDPSPLVRLYLLSAMQRLNPATRWNVMHALLAHAEDGADHNIPLMAWFAAEPLAGIDASRAADLALTSPWPRLLEFMIRRMASGSSPDALEIATAKLSKAGDESRQLAILTGLSAALKGQRAVPLPAGWEAIEQKLAASPNRGIRALAQALSLTFGSARALESTRRIVTNTGANVDERSHALDSLLGIKDPALPPVLLELLHDSRLRAFALRGLAAYDDPKTPDAILAIYHSLTVEEKRDALFTLVSRPSFARPLLAAIAGNLVPVKDLSAEIARPLRGLNQPDLTAQLEKVWGVSRETPPDKLAAQAKYKKLVENKNLSAPDPARGRRIFNQICGLCHTLFGSGGKIGPDLTGSNRADLDYLLHNIIDPNAEIPNAFRTATVELKDGRVLAGIANQQDADVVSIVTPNETLTLPVGEIKTLASSEISMMPEGLLTPSSDRDVRDLISYLRGPEQVPMPPEPGKPGSK